MVVERSKLLEWGRANEDNTSARYQFKNFVVNEISASLVEVWFLGWYRQKWFFLWLSSMLIWIFNYFLSLSKI